MLLIALGATALSFPVSQQSPLAGLSFLDCLFTAASAVTLTGLVTVNTAGAWSLIGKIILLALIQIGALGYMTAATVIALRMGLRLGLSSRLQIPSLAHGYLQRRDLWRIGRYTLFVTLALEGIGAGLLIAHLYFHQVITGVGDALFAGVFYAVSAFCNAGFDLVPAQAGASFAVWHDHIVLALSGLLALLGGLGISVLFDLVNLFRRQRISLHTRLVLTSTLVLIVIGAGLYLLFELPTTSDPLTVQRVAHQTFYATLLSVNARSAGFTPVDLNSLMPPTLLTLLLLMFIGGAPGSTAGGVKVITVAVIALAIATLIKRRSDIEVFRRRLSGEMVRLALSLVMVSLAVIFLLILSISWIELRRHGLSASDAAVPFMRIVFEVFSAFGNTGFKIGLTDSLAPASRVLLIAAMCFGRLGPLVFLYRFAQPRKPLLRRLPSESVVAG